MKLLQTLRKWRWNRVCIEVRKNSMLLVLVLIIFVLYAGVPQNRAIVASKNFEVTQDSHSNLVESDHYLYAATYSVKGTSRSTLGLNNAMMSRARVVRVTLYSKAGEPLDLPEITLAPSATRFLNIRDWITPEQIGAFSEGSVEVYFHGPGMAIGAQLTVSDERHNQSFDVLLREDANFSSSKLDSLWLSLDHQTTVDVFVANTRPYATTLTPTVYVNGEALRGESITLDSHMATTIDGGLLLRKLRVRRQVVAGGISLEHNGQPGAIAVAGVMSNRQRGFSSTMRFVDIAGQGSTRLHGANILIGAVNPQYGLPQDANFTARAVVRNTTGLPVEVKARVRYTADDGLGAKEIEPLTLSANEVRELDLNSTIAELGGKQIVDAGFELEHGGEPGSVIAAVLSVDQSGNHVFDVPLKDPRSVRNVGGNYPWRIDGDNRAVVHIKNIDPVTDGLLRQFALMITTAAGKYSFPVQLTEAGETVAIDIRKLRDEQIPDNHGNVIPLHVTEGQIEWYGRGPLGQFVGRLVQYNPTTGVSSSMSCETFCDCEPIYISCRLTPTSISGYPGQTFDMRAWETDQRCDGSTFECEVTHIATFTPLDPAVISVVNTSFSGPAATATLEGQDGITSINATWPVPGPSCGSTISVNHLLDVTNLAVTVTIDPLIAVAKGGTAQVQVTISQPNTSVDLTLSTKSNTTGAAKFASNNSSSLTINQTTSVEVKGETESSKTDNIVLRARIRGSTKDTEDFSVLWVTLSLRTSGSVPTDNAGRTTYSSVLGTTNLGTFLSTGTGNRIWRTGVEIVGTVAPSDFPNAILLTREVVAFRQYSESTLAASGGPFGDTSDASLRDDDPQSGGSSGKVYDLDAPGLGSTSSAPIGRILRIRTNFRQWASFNNVKVSSDLNWFSRISIEKTSSGDVLRNDVSGDNVAGAGPTLLTWNLQ